MMLFRTTANLALGGALALLALTARPAPAQDAGEFQLHAITVTAARPGEGDAERIRWRKKKLEDKSADPSPVYLVKLYAEVPPAGATGYQIQFGDEPIREFSSFPGGLFFKVYHRQDLKKLVGKGLKVGRGRKEPQEAGRSFPSESELEPVLAKPLGELRTVADELAR